MGIDEQRLKQLGVRASEMLAPAVPNYWGEKDDFLHSNANPTFHEGTDLPPPLFLGWALERGSIEDQRVQVRSSSRLVLIGNVDFIRDESLTRTSRDVDRKDVTGVEITNESDHTVLNKTAAGWQIIAPVNDRADARVVDSLLDNIQFLRRDDTISNLGKGEKKQKRLKDFGLLKPHLKLVWQTKKRRSTIEFGADTAVEGTCYVHTEGSDAVFVTGNELKNLVSKRSNAFRDPQITPFLTAQIDRMIVHQAAGDIELVRQQNGWQIVRPIKARADDDTVNAALEKINATPILDFAESEKVPNADTENSGRSLSLFSGDEKVEIFCGSPGPKT